MRKLRKVLSIGAASALLVSTAALTASAEVLTQNSVSTIKTSENIKSSSTVYVGEVTLDGKAAVKYIYSDNFSHEGSSWNDLIDALKGMSDTDFSALLGEYDKTAGESGIKACSDASLVSKMDSSWAKASAVGEKYYSDYQFSSEVSKDLYDHDAGFRAKLDGQKAARAQAIDEPFDNSKTIVSHLDSKTVTDVYYTIEDGQVVRHTDTKVIYESEEVTVIYTGANMKNNGSTRVNVKDKKTTVVQDSTLYVGEIVVDGESKIKYLWSEDMTRSEAVTAAVRDALNALEDKDFAALLPEIVGEEEAKGIAECNIAGYESSMGSSWKDSKTPAALYYPGAAVKASASADLYDTDEGFAGACGFKEEADATVVDNAGQAYEAHSPLGKLSAANTDTVTYTVENGVIIKLIDRTVDYTCEAVKVICTRTELTTPAEPVDSSVSEDISDSDGSVASAGSSTADSSESGSSSSRSDSSSSPSGSNPATGIIGGPTISGGLILAALVMARRKDKENKK